jgi:hypothetical protein
MPILVGCPSVFCKPDKIRGKMGRKPFYVEKEAAYGTTSVGKALARNGI